MIRRFVRRVLHWMALMGFLVQDDRPLEVREPDREWGTSVGGLVLSAKAKGERLSIILKNIGQDEIRATIPEWLFFYRLEISGSPPLTGFGKQALDPHRKLKRTELILNPGQPIEAEIPVDALYDIQGDTHRVRVSCEIAGVMLVSNQVELCSG